MSRSNNNPQARAALDKFKYEAGSIGGEMVKKLVAKAANEMQQGM